MERAARRRHAGAREEEGVTVVLVALLLTVLFTMAALGVDISSQVNQRQELRDTVDVAAHAGAYELPGAGNATFTATEAAIRASVTKNDPTFDMSKLQIDFFCVVASERIGSSNNYRPAAYTIPAVCNPVSKRVSSDPLNLQYTGMVCNQQMCAIPCDLKAGDKCNTVKVRGDKTVDYQFAPVIGERNGSTGLLDAAACKGPCAQLQGSPLDIMFVVDRSTSMLTDEVIGYERKCILIFICWDEPITQRINHIEVVRDALNGTNGMNGVFDLLLSDRHRVGLATIHKANRSVRTNDSTNNSTHVNEICSSSSSGSAGTWVPIPLTNAFGPTSMLRKVVNCLPTRTTTFTVNNVGHTDFDGPMDASAEALRNAPPHATGIAPRRAIIFLTDGEANVSMKSGQPCQLGVQAADRAKQNDDILVITIAYRLTDDNKCSRDASGPYRNALATDVLAAMASRTDASAPAAANNLCKGAATQNGTYELENSDGDFFFCAPQPADLLPVFQAALAAVTENITILRLPI